MKRSLSAILCLLYLSISTVFAAAHHHDGVLDDQQCAACSWHHNGVVDEPAPPLRVVRLDVIHFVEQDLSVAFRERSVRIHPSRGPPAILL